MTSILSAVFSSDSLNIWTFPLRLALLNLLKFRTVMITTKLLKHGPPVPKAASLWSQSWWLSEGSRRSCYFKHLLCGLKYQGLNTLLNVLYANALERTFSTYNIISYTFFRKTSVHSLGASACQRKSSKNLAPPCFSPHHGFDRLLSITSASSEYLIEGYHKSKKEEKGTMVAPCYHVV